MFGNGNGFGPRRLLVGLALLLLAGCATGSPSGSGAVGSLPPPPDTIAPFNGVNHSAALRDPKLQAALDIDRRGDSAAAAKAYAVAADSGNPIARYQLGEMYLTGDGVPRDTAEAIRQFHAGALAGYAPDQVRLGDAYEKGIGVPHDQALANRWYGFAAAQGEDSASGRLAMSMMKGAGMPRDVDGALKILQHCAEPTGTEVYHPSGDDGGPGCQALLGGIYMEGDGGVPVDQQQGIRWMSRAADQHMPVAEKKMADFYEQGRGVPRDSEKAAYWRHRAEQDADNGPGYRTAL
ncbi:MAG TPA: tetratricopeptide repeat protein [Dongiaceae bacterium]|nr:tetratricopeptide repeat protein [Dongiaceae bacterium]